MVGFGVKIDNYYYVANLDGLDPELLSVLVTVGTICTELN